MHAHGQVVYDRRRSDYVSEMKRYRKVLVIALGIAVLEILGGLWSGSLALLSDAGHVVTGDVLATLIAMVVSEEIRRRPSSHERRIQANGAYVLGVLFFLAAIPILYGAWERSQIQAEIQISPTMLVIAVIGFFGNYWQAIVMSDSAEHGVNLGLRGHVHTDAIQSIGVIITGLVIWLTDWMLIDLICSVAIAIALIYWGLKTIRSARKQSEYYEVGKGGD